MYCNMKLWWGRWSAEQATAAILGTAKVKLRSEDLMLDYQLLLGCQSIFAKNRLLKRRSESLRVTAGCHHGGFETHMCHILGTCPDMTLAVERNIKQQLFLPQGNCSLRSEVRQHHWLLCLKTIWSCSLKVIVPLISNIRQVDSSTMFYVYTLSSNYIFDDNDWISLVTHTS